MTSPLTASPVVAVVESTITAVMVGTLADVVVLDAMGLTQVYEARSVTVGGNWDPDSGAMSGADAVTVEVSEHGLGRSLVETTHISCVAFSGTGSSDLSADRTSMNAILSAVRGAVRAITDVGGSSARAEMASQQWAQIIDGQGSGVLVTFDITVMVLP